MVAHELGHQKHNDLLRGLAWLAIVAPAGTFLTQALAERVRGAGDDSGTPGRRCRRSRSPCRWSSLGLGIASNVLSRPVEASADSFALELTRDPARLHRLRAPHRDAQHLATPTRRGCCHVLFGTHPTTMERIGIGEAFRV